MLYPLTFEPILKERIWGGTKLNTLLGKRLPNGTAGESWEISTIPGDISVVSNGTHKGKSLTKLIEEHPREILGNAVYERFGTQFPLLIKFIDARDDLSIQVHPNDKLAQERHNCMGKTEMWYVMDADEDARIIVGFKNKSSPEQYIENLRNKSLGDILHQVPVKPGDVYLIETGTIHAIGAGTLLAEIQQTSDITYRIYDWDRVDTAGKSRELHIDQALEAMNYNVVNAKQEYPTTTNKPSKVLECPHFAINHISVDGQTMLTHNASSFRIYICTEGQFNLETPEGRHHFKKGNTLLIPAALRNFVIEGKAVLLETHIPQPY